jgi:hypothetical protein
MTIFYYVKTERFSADPSHGAERRFGMTSSPLSPLPFPAGPSLRSG